MTVNRYDVPTRRRTVTGLAHRAALLLALALPVLAARPAAAQVRIKDITDVQGVRNNQLIGYGLVVGLNNTGDKLDNSIFTRKSLIGMLERLGVNTQDHAAKLKPRMSPR